MIRSENCKRRNCPFYKGFYCEKYDLQVDKPGDSSCPEDNYNYWDDDFN